MSFSNFLVCAAERSGEVAARYAARLSSVSGASLVLADVMERVPKNVIRELPAGWDVPRLVRKRKADSLRQVGLDIRRLGLRPKVKLLEGDPIDALVAEVKRGHHDLLVAAAPAGDMVNAGRATAARLVRQCPCAVLLVHGSLGRRRPRVLVAVDSSPLAGRNRDAMPMHLIESALWVAEQLNGELHVLHAWDSYGENQLRRAGGTPGEVGSYRLRVRRHAMEQLQRLVAPFGDRVPNDRLHLEKGDARKAIPAFAAETRTDLLVMGTVGRSGLARFVIGNTVEGVLVNLPCSMLVVRPARRR